MNFGSDSGSDSDTGMGKYDQEDPELKADVPAQATSAPTSPAATVPGALIPIETSPQRAIAVRTPQQIEMAENVDAVANSTIVKSLERNYMDNETAQKCMAVLGYAPPNLMDLRVQQLLIQKNPALQTAFTNPMIRGFAFGINRTALTMCNGLMLASIARCLLNDCLERMGLESKGREQLLKMSRQISKQMEIIAERTNEFVKSMAVNIREMGTVATLLRYDADVEILLGKIREVNLAVNGRVDEMDKASDAALGPIAEGCEYIQSVLQNDQGLSNKKREVVSARGLWEAQQEVHRGVFDAFYNKEGELEYKRAELTGQIKLYNKQIKTRQADLVLLEARIESLGGTIRTFEQMKQDIESDRTDESKENRSIKKAAYKAVEIEIAAQQAAFDNQIGRLQKRAAKIGQQCGEYRSKSMTASDGTELYITKETRGYWFWSRRTSYKEERKTTRPNEKQRLEVMAQKAETEARKLESEIERLTLEKGQVQARVQERLSQSCLKIAKDNEEYASNQHGKRLREIDQQVRYFVELKDDVEGTQGRMREAIQGLEQQVASANTKLEDVNKKLEVLNFEGNVEKNRIEEAALEEKRLAEEYEVKRQEYQRLVKEFGIASGQDFDSFMKVFRLLNKAGQNLPQAMRMLSKSFQGAYETFNSDFFRKDILALSERGRRQCLLDVSTDMQAICEVGWEFFEAPLQNMIRVDSGAVLGQLIAMERKAAIEDSPSSVVIEEVKDDGADDGPPRAVDYQVQEHEEPLRS